MDHKDYLYSNGGKQINFWYRARLVLIEKLLSSVLGAGNSDRPILDVGCGTGTELPVLGKFGAVQGVDNDQAALAIARDQGYDVAFKDLAEEKLPAESYQVICCFDFFEHLKDDQTVMQNIFLALKPGGYLFFSVPAFPFLFGPHDLAMSHCRRYGKRQIEKKLSACGFKEVQTFYWNTLLFPLIAIFRLVKNFFLVRLFGKNEFRSDVGSVSGPLDRVFYFILKTETDLLFRNKYLPFGLTIYGLAKK